MDNYDRRLNDDYYHQKRANTSHLDQLQEALLLQHRQLQEDEAHLTRNTERLSPASSISSCQELNQLHNNTNSSGKLKKRATSTSSGLKSLGRIFSGSKKNKTNDR